MSIKLFNVREEEYVGNNVYLIHRPNILSNPYTHIKNKETKAMFVVKSREDALNSYSRYYDIMYGKNKDFTYIIDEIYEKYKNGEEIFFGCYCDTKKKDKIHCHGEIIIQKLQNRLIKEKFLEIKRKKNLL